MGRSRGTFILLLAVAAVSGAFWVGPGSSPELGEAEAVSFLAASLSVVAMAGCFLLALRVPMIGVAFCGLDKAYVVHKVLGIAAVVLVAVHFFALGDDDDDHDEAESAQVTVVAEHDPEETERDEDGIVDGLGFLVDPLGLVAGGGFLLLLIVTLNRRIPYHHWFKTHRLMGVLFVLVVVHVGIVLLDGWLVPLRSPLGAVLALALLVGLGSWVARELSRGRVAQAFVVEDAERRPRTLDLVLRSEGDPMAFQPGQFAFVRFEAEGLREPHPFTIASAPHQTGLRFVVRTSGDFTRRLHADLQPGTRAHVEGPYGAFTPLAHPGPQVWVAGGVGIAPFLSALGQLARETSPPAVTLFYSFRHRADAAALEDLEALCRDNQSVALHLVETAEGGRLTAEDIVGPSEASYWFCGPSPLVQDLAVGLRQRGVASTAIHHEVFEMR